MSLVKSKLRNNMGDSLLDDCLVTLLTYIEWDVFSEVNEDDIMDTFMAMQSVGQTVFFNFSSSATDWSSTRTGRRRSARPCRRRSLPEGSVPGRIRAPRCRRHRRRASPAASSGYPAFSPPGPGPAPSSLGRAQHH